MDNTLKIKKHRKVSLDSRKARAGYVFTLPFILGILLVYLPILVDSIWMSFHDIDRTGEVDVYVFNHFQYYKDAFVSSNAFATNLLAGLQELVFEVPAVIIFSLFIAVVLNGKMLGRAAFRAIFFVPVIISTGVMTGLMSQDNAATSEMQGGVDDGSGGGIINTLEVEALFRNMAIGGDLVTVVVNLVNDIYSIINYSGVQMLIFLAGLQSISESIYEACRIDGATGWETFWKVTFPMISPMILVNAVYTVIDSFTRSTNATMKYIQPISGPQGASERTALYWIYFLVIIAIIAVIAGVISSYIFYQRKD
ncbi:MAG: sugar ABC transporter permease [Clostridia bacterium]|nr:sugar ABC transporter permease [Clostridia bacterium]MBR3680956.1 sugar ABC transporter permease [Clostridia bacterium]